MMLFVVLIIFWMGQKLGGFNFLKPASKLSFWGSREKSRESHTRRETRVREVHLLARSFAAYIACHSNWKACSQVNFLGFRRQRSRVVSASDSQCGSPGPGFEFRSVLGHTCNLLQTEPLIFKHWSVSWPPTHLLAQLPATIVDKTV